MAKVDTSRARRWLATALLLGSTIHAVAWSADAPSREDKKRAAAQFHEAEALFKKHAYAEAAEAFERAHAIAPHPAALMNGVDAHVRAGQIARAANLCAQLLREVPPDNPHAAEARRQLADLKAKVGLLRVEGEAARVTIDGKPSKLGEVYVDPGDHVVEGTVGDQPVTRKVQATAGATTRVVFDRAAPPPKDEKPPPPPTLPEPEKPQGRGVSPTWIYVGAGATAVLGGVTVWSGLATNAARRDFDSHPTQAGLDDGKSKQSRTNLLLGATAIVGLSTAAVAWFATDWGTKPASAGQGAPRTRWGASPGAVWVQGAF